MKKKGKRGGARDGAGRKPYANRKEIRVPLTIHPKTGSIEDCGGSESAKQIALHSIENFEQNIANAKK